MRTTGNKTVVRTILYDGHPVEIVQVWPARNVTGEPLLTVRSLDTDWEWEVWEYELRGDYRLIKKSVHRAERTARRQ